MSFSVRALAALLIFPIFMAGCATSGGSAEERTSLEKPFWQQDGAARREAVLHFDSLLRREPENAALYAGRARVYLELGAPDQAWRDVEQALKLDPDLAQAWVTRAAVALFTQPVGPVQATPSGPSMDGKVTAKDIELARKDLKHALDLAPENARAYAYLGKAARLAGEPEAALESLRTALDLDGDLVMAHVESARVYTQLGRWEEAAESYREAAALKPGDASLLQQAAQACWEAAEYGAARELLCRAAQIKPGDHFIFMSLALVEAADGEPEQALEYDAMARRKAALLNRPYRSPLIVSTPEPKSPSGEDDEPAEVEEVEPEVRPAFLPQSLEQQEQAQAAPEAQPVESRPERDLMAEAREALQGGKPALALALISKHFDSAEPLAGDYCLQSRTLAALNELDMAQEAAQKAIDADPDESCGYNNLGVLLARSDPQAALEVFDRGVERSPDRAPMRNERGKLHLLRKQFDQAEADFTACIEADPNTPVYRLHRAIARYQQGEYEAALEDADKFLLMSPNAAEGYRTRAAIHGKLGNTQQAAQDLESEQRLQGGE